MERIAAHYDSILGENTFVKGPARKLEEWFQIRTQEDITNAVTGNVTVAHWFDHDPKLNAKSRLVGVKLVHPTKISKLLGTIAGNSSGQLTEKRLRSVPYYVFARPFRVAVGRGIDFRLEFDHTPETDLHRLPSNCIAVLGDDLVYSDNAAAMKEAIRSFTDDTERLRDSISYKLVATHMRRLTRSRPVVLSYADPVDGWSNLFSVLERKELLTSIGQFRNPFVDVRPIVKAISGKTSVPFHEIANHLAPSGSLVTFSDGDLIWTFIALRRDAASPAKTEK